MKKKILIIFLFIVSGIVSSCSREEDNIIVNPVININNNDPVEQKGWVRQQSGVTNRLLDVFFISDETGWAAGFNGVVLRTTNGGTNWIKSNTDSVTFLTSLHFINSQTGWVCGYKGKIFKSTDGGISWNQQAGNSSKTFYSIWFISEKLGWVCGEVGKISRTTDGGSAWIAEESNSSSALYSIHFISETRGRACGNYALLNSYDGGVTWINEQSSPYLNWIYFANELTGWLAHGPNISKSSDGGASWINLAPSGTGINKFNAPSIDTLYGCSESGAIIKSINGGTGWIQPDSFITRQLNSIDFTDNNIGWAVGQDGVILKTTTGGR